jgi:HEAT repeat protein
MTTPDQPPSPDHLIDLLDEGAHEETAACLDRLGTADTDARKRALRALRSVAAERPGALGELAAPLSAFLTDEARAVRLTTAKLFVTLAESEPAAVLPAVDVLAERLAADEEFYYVRARCAEALGYVAVEAPEAVTDPEKLADLRVGLEFDEPEVKEKLAKALACVALGDPSRLRHQVTSLAEHLDDGNELVRYHLCTALVTVGCDHPGRLADATDALRERLTDENPYVRGRAAEALGLAAESDAEIDAAPDIDVTDTSDEAPSFLIDRTRYLRRRLDGTQPGAEPAGVGTTASLRDGIEAVVEEMTSPDDGECPHCGLELPASSPPMCPRCGVPR